MFYTLTSQARNFPRERLNAPELYILGLFKNLSETLDRNTIEEYAITRDFNVESVLYSLELQGLITILQYA